jgi:ParB-like chromosome segregation protein Spo0J
MMQIVEIPIDELKPYENNPRKIGDDAVEAVAASLEAFRYKLSDRELEIVAGLSRK